MYIYMCSSTQMSEALQALASAAVSGSGEPELQLTSFREQVRCTKLPAKAF
jgi:hypothetical protein